MVLGPILSQGLQEADAKERRQRMERRAKRRSRVEDLKQRGVIGEPPAAGAPRPARQRRPAQRQGQTGNKAIGTVITILIVIAIIALKVWARSS